jgi:DNA-binding FrmR family transcriptional regulator
LNSVSQDAALAAASTRNRRKALAAYTPTGYADRMHERTHILNRLKRVEGQVRGVAAMIEDERYCIDVLTQLRAVRAALVRVETAMLKDHLSHCIEDAIVGGSASEQRKKAAELVELVGRSER